MESSFFLLFYRHWLFDEVRRPPTEENNTRPNDVPFGAGGFHWQ